jgi:hypothetical protein
MNEERLEEARKSLCGWSGCDDCQMLREAIAEIERLWDQQASIPQTASRLGGCLLSCLFLGFCWGIGIAGAVLAYRIMT